MEPIKGDGKKVMTNVDLHCPPAWHQDDVEICEEDLKSDRDSSAVGVEEEVWRAHKWRRPRSMVRSATMETEAQMSAWRASFFIMLSAYNTSVGRTKDQKAGLARLPQHPLRTRLHHPPLPYLGVYLGR